MIIKDFVQEIERIPTHLWGAMPTWNGSMLRLGSDELNVDEKPAYEGKIASRYKSEEAFDYVWEHRHDLSLACRKPGDRFEINFMRLHDSLYGQCDYFRYDDGEWLMTDFLTGTSYPIPAEGPTNRWRRYLNLQSIEFKIIGWNWNYERTHARRAHPETIVRTKKQQARRSVKNTQTLMKFGTRTVDFRNETEAFLEKIQKGTLTKSEAVQFQSECMSMISWIKQHKGKLH